MNAGLTINTEEKTVVAIALQKQPLLLRVQPCPVTTQFLQHARVSQLIGTVTVKSYGMELQMNGIPINVRLDFEFYKNSL